MYRQGSSTQFTSIGGACSKEMNGYYLNLICKNSKDPFGPFRKFMVKPDLDILCLGQNSIKNKKYGDF